MSDQLSLDDALEATATGAEGWMSQFMQAVNSLPVGTVFTTYDLQQITGLPDPAKPSQWGAAQTKAADLGLCVFVRFVRSRRPTTKGSATGEWRRLSARIGRAA